jgi:soluble lytic murein transglycosylase-like protein
VSTKLELGKIWDLVKANNVSSLSDATIIAQIYMESRFDPKAGASHNAKGLMQVQLNAVKQVYKYRKQKQVGHMPSDADTKKAFAEATVFYNSGKLYDGATNIAIGTEYMQYWLDVAGSIEEAYKRYRGRSDGLYYQKIKSAATALDKNPTSMQPLYDNIGK